MAAHGLIQTRIETIQWSNASAKLSALTNTASTAEATSPATRVIFQRAARTPIDNAASEQEYRFRMFVAIGPCTSSSSTGTAITPKVLTTNAVLNQPSGIESSGGLTFVTDAQTSKIHAFDNTTGALVKSLGCPLDPAKIAPGVAGRPQDADLTQALLDPEPE